MPRLPRQRRLIVEALEPRLMFSATADIAVFHDSSADTDYLSQAADELDLSQIYALNDDPAIIDSDLPPDYQATSSSAPRDITETQVSSLPGLDDIQIKAAACEVPDSPKQPDGAPVPDLEDSALLLAAAKTDATLDPTETQTLAPPPPVFVFVDTTVKNYEALVQDIQEQYQDQNLTIVYLDPNANGVQQISDSLANQTDVAAIHLITHGSAGSFQLGNAAVNQNTLDQYRDEFSSWQRFLSADADILIYGCDVASTEAGQALIEQLGLLTQADIAASNNLTGAVAQGGDWALEVHYGTIETNVLISAQTQEEWDNILANTNYVYVASGSSTQTFTATSNVGQSFLYDSSGSTYTVNQICVQLKTLAGAATQSIYVTLRNSWDGSILRSDSISSSQLSTDFEWYAFDFSNYNLNKNQTYVIQIYTLGTDGKVAVCYNSGNAWNNSEIIVNGSGNSSNDLTFAISYDDGSNQAPYVNSAIPNQAATEHVAFNYPLPTNTFKDNDLGDRLTYTATLASGAALPSWLSFNAATRTFSGTPGSNDAGTISVKVTASDGAATGSDTFDIVIANNNNAPTVANAIPDKAATEDSAFSFQFASNTFADADVGDTLTYIATLSNGSALPSWLTFNAATRTFSGTPLNGDVGTIAVKVTADDSQGGTVSDTFNITVANTNDAPTVANLIPDKAATEDSAFSFQFAANTFADVDVGDTLTYSATLSSGAALPSWLSFNAATRTFSGTPLNADVGTITVRVTASDGNGGTVSDNFDIVIANTNDAPTVANAIPDQGATEDSAFNFQFASNTFNDVDVGDTLTYSVTLSGGGALPSWLSFNAATRTFSGTPTNSDVGTISVRVTANDGNGGTVNDTFDIVVANTNDAPTVANAIPDKAATEDSAFSFQFAANTFADVDVGDTLTYSATLSGGGMLPSWLTFNAATRTFSGTPLNADVGTISVRVTASDGNGGTVSDTFDIVVANTNDAPTVANAIPDQAASEDSAFNFQFAANTFNDADVGDTLSYSATLSGGGGLPSWLTFNSGTRTFSGTPSNADVGTISVQVTANDGHGGIISDTFDIVIANTNDAPTVANAISNKAATEDAAFSFQFPSNTFADVDVGDTLTYSAALAGGGGLPAWLSFNSGTRTFSGTPANGDVGTISIRLTASDGNGGTVDALFDIVVANTNDAPTVANTIPDQGATQNSPFSFQFAANTFNDVDVGDTLTYSATVGGGALPSWLSFDPNTRTFSGTPLSNHVGTITVQVTASDGHGGTINDSFDIVVANINDAPTVANAIPDRSVVKLNPFNYQFPANTFNDVDGDTLTYSAQLSGGGGLPVWLSFDPNTRTFSGTPQPGDVGTITVEVIASDGSLTVSDTFNIAVTNTNFAPTVANTIPDQNATEDAAFNFQFASNTFDDVDGDTLSYSATLSGGTPLPSWLIFDSATRTFSGTPLNGDVGTISVEVTADDGSLTVSDTFDIVIANTNDAPTVANPIPNQNATEDAAFNFQFAVNTFNDVDAGASLTYSAQLAGGGSLPSWLIFDPNTRTFSGTPLNANVGTLSIDVIADDGNGGTVTDTFNIVIANTNDAPTVANAIPNQNATEDVAFNFQFASNTFNDVDVGDTLGYSATLSGGAPLPSWLTFNAATRTFSGTPLNANVGTISVEITADDGNGGSITDTFDIVIANSNDAPTVTNPIADQNATEDAAFNFQFAANTFNDVDVGDSLTYNATLAGGGLLPSWLSFNAGTRTFSGTPSNSDVGTISIEVTADDGNGGTVTDTFNIVIANTNDAPTVANPIANQNATEDAAFNFQFASNTFNDVDVGDSLAYSATLSGGSPLPSWLSFNAATRTFSGTPLNADVGTISIEVTADDGNGGTITDTFDIVIANTNDAPTVANPIPNQNATEDAAFNFQFAVNTFADVDTGASLTYSAQLAGGGTLPPWLIFNPATRTFSGTPLNADVGTISIDVIADDGNGGTVTDTFDIVIANTNDAPTVANPIPNQNATEDAAFNFQFASNTFNDVDVGNTLTYTATLAGGAPLPSWLSFDPNTRTFSGTPLNADVGTLTIEVTANDSQSGTVSDSFDIVIANTNDAPTVANAIANQAATEDSPFNFQFAANTFNDIDVGDTLTYTATLVGGAPLPAWLSFDANTRTFSGTPLNADVGTLSIEVTANDNNGGTVSNGFDIVIANTNDAPTVANAIPDQVANEDSLFNFQFAANTFADIDAGSSLTYTVTLAGGGALPAWLSFDANTRTFSGTPSNSDVGNLAIKVTANDGQGGIASDTFDLVINNVNDAPTVANPIPDQNATEDSAFSFQFNSNTFDDEDVGAVLSYSAHLSGGGALPSWLSFDANTRTFSGTPLNADVGTLSIEVTANDGQGGTVSDTFDIVIANTNDAPTVVNAIANQTATEDSAFNFQIPANTFIDIDPGSTLTYSTQLSGGAALPSWLSFNPATQTFTGTPGNSDVGTLSVEVTVDDGLGGVVSDTFNIFILNSNDAPTVANTIPNQSASEDSAFSFQFAANTFADEDLGDSLSYSALANGGPLPSWLSFDASTRTFSGTPFNADVGSLSIEVTASDGHGGTVSTSFILDIANTNDAPVVANPIANQQVDEDSVFNFQIPGNTFIDVDAGSSLTYTATQANGSALPSWLNFDASTRTFSGTPGNSDVGTLSIRVSIDDGLGGLASNNFNIVVVNTNDAPTLVNAIPDQQTLEDAPFHFQFAANTFNDVDVGDTLSYSATLAGGAPLPSWLSFDAATRTFSGTPDNSQVGNLSIQVTASDGKGGSVSDTFTLVVINTPDAPVVAHPLQNKSVIITEYFNFSIPADTFHDDDGDSLTYSVHLSGGGTLPAWLTFDPATLSFSGIAPKSALGKLISLEVSVDDGHGGSVSSSFALSIEKSLEVTPETPVVTEKPSLPTVEIPVAKPPVVEVVNPDTPQQVDPVTDNSSTTLDRNWQTLPILISLGDPEPVEDKNNARLMDIRDSLNIANTSPLLAGLISPDAGFSVTETEDFNSALRRIHDEMNDVIDAENLQKTLIAGMTFSITTGLIIWSLRASSLLLTLMSMVPLWSGMDPLPILDQVNKRKAELEQQRKDKQKEDENAKEVGYLFDQSQSPQDGKKPK
ncbi:MAG TPA: putative Ig domain-containing protein [Cellvibrio sp.]|nr:putative Ig domain-containing protein [Cellvibrio sp.]